MRFALPGLAAAARKAVPARYRPVGYLINLTRQRCNNSVHSGPFHGMRYINRAIGSAYIPKLLGIYEKELHAVVERACSLDFSLILDIGSAEGYYAVGMALRNAGARIEAFEMNPEGVTALGQM